jgi:DNA-binding NtrC family response regulator
MTRAPQSTEPVPCTGLAGSSRALRRFLSELHNVAPSDAPVFIWGEAGVGKERAARTLHALSPRRNLPFVVLRCLGLDARGLQRALYGAQECADRIPAGRTSEDVPPAVGVLQEARGGTLLLDEIESLEDEAQTELLRALHGLSAGCSPSRRRLPAPRLVSNCTEDLDVRVRRGRFRRDLYHRLAVVRLHLPALRTRREDIPALAIDLIAEQALNGAPSFALDDEALGPLRDHPWPGNVRELASVLLQASWRARDGVLRIGDLGDLLSPTALNASVQIPLGTSLAVAEQILLRATLAAHGGNKKRTAETLGISRRTLYLKLARS